MCPAAPLIFRVACWPIETISSLRSPGFAAEVDELVAEEAALHRAASSLCDALFESVPQIARGAKRAAILRLRRALFRNVDPLDIDDLRDANATSELPDPLRSAIAHHDHARKSVRRKRQLLETRYPAVVAAERQQLFRVADDPAFRKALWIASPSAAAEWEKCRGSGAQGADGRLASTLWGYVVRAAGRATPNGLWAGVTIEDRSVAPQDDQLRVRESQLVVRVKPDLNVFQHVLSAMRRSAEARTRLCFRLNPSLTSHGQGVWRYLSECGGVWRIIEIEQGEVLGPLRAILRRDGPMPLARLAALSQTDPIGLLEFVEAGVLWAVPDWPEIVTDAWDALDEIYTQLPEEDRRLWAAALEGCRRASLESSERWSEYEPADVGRMLHEVRARLNELLQHYGADPLPADQCPLVIDCLAPFRIAASDALRERLTTAARRCFQFNRGGLAELQAREARRQMRRHAGSMEALSLGGSVWECAPAVREDPLPTATDDAAENCWEAEARMFENRTGAEKFLAIAREWTERITPFAHCHATSVNALDRGDSEPCPPGAALVMVLGEGNQARVRVGSISSDFCAFYARFHHNFDPACDPFGEWLDGAVGHITGFERLAPADCAAYGTFDRNAALRPRLTDRVLNLFADSRVTFDARSDSMERLDLRRRGSPDRFIPLINSAVDLSSADPYSAWLQAHAQLLGRPTLLRPLPPLQAELQTWRHLPQLELDGDIIIATERWHIPDDEAASWARLAPFDRFVSWRKRVAGWQLPDLLSVRAGQRHTDSLLPADSALGVEILARCVRAHRGRIQLQEPFARPADLWLRDSRGAHYVAEVAVSWAGDDEFWRGLTPRDR